MHSDGLASMLLRLIIQPWFISEFDIFALSLRPLLIPLLLLQSSSVSQGASVHPYILRLQQLSCKPEKQACLQQESFEATNH